MDKLIISKDDLALTSELKLRYDKSNGYYRVTINRKYQYLHRFLLGAKKGDVVDHIDRNKHNNLRENLRIVTISLNNYNRDTKNKLGRGIYFDNHGNRYRACISHNNKTIKLGSFKDILDAKKAYNTKALEIHGDNAELHAIE